MSAPTPRLRLAVALDGAGWHPAAWREPNARPGDLLRPGYWADLVREAEAGLLDFVTIEDSLSIQTDVPFGTADDDRTDRVRGRLDAVLVASRIAPLTSHIGIVPTAVVTHTEPFHLSKAIATLDYVSRGRAGVRVQVAPRRRDAALFGRREFPESTGGPGEDLLREAFAEAADYVEVLRRLWDSWEDDAEIRDVATGRFIDRDKIHYIDFEGLHFDVKGPSITPRPPQGQPVVAALAHRTAPTRSVPFELVGTSADVGFVTPRTAAEIASITAEIRTARTAAGRDDETVHVFGDVFVVLGETEQAARERLARLEETAGAAYVSDALVFAGTPEDLADLLATWHAAGLSGFRLRPAVLPDDLRQITRRLVPELQRRGLFHDAYDDSTLRGALGLPRPTSRYATTERTPA